MRGVHFPGFVADPRAFLAGLHLYVQPSWSEGFCIAAHEAMQAGLPVIASAVGELARSVEPGATGELVMPGAVEPLAGKIAAMIADPRGMAAIGAQARAKVLERFGAEAFEARGRAVMERLVSGGAARTGAASRAVPRSQGRGATASSA
ncbi:glycosyltransferase [Rhizorhabdus histidinilytica]